MADTNTTSFMIYWTTILRQDRENLSDDNWTLRTIYFRILVFAAIEYLPSDFFLLNSQISRS